MRVALHPMGWGQMKTRKTMIELFVPNVRKHLDI